LHGVVGQISVAQNSERDRHALIADRAREGIESFSVAPFRTLDKRSVHRTLFLDSIRQSDEITLESQQAGLKVPPRRQHHRFRPE